MLKKSASSVLASFRPSTLRRSTSEVGSTGGAFPFAKIHSMGVRPTRSAVCTSSGLHSLRPCPRNGASRRAGVGRVRSLAFLSILQECSPIGHTCGPSKSSRAVIIVPQPAKQAALHRTGEAL
jgi:hypothetical protein